MRKEGERKKTKRTKGEEKGNKEKTVLGHDHETFFQAQNKVLL